MTSDQPFSENFVTDPRVAPHHFTFSWANDGLYQSYFIPAPSHLHIVDTDGTVLFDGSLELLKKIIYE